jgi:hypothetical protein
MRPVPTLEIASHHQLSSSRINLDTGLIESTFGKATSQLPAPSSNPVAGQFLTKSASRTLGRSYGLRVSPF